MKKAKYKNQFFIETIDGTNVHGIEKTFRTLPKSAKPFKSYYDVDMNLWTLFLGRGTRYLVKHKDHNKTRGSWF